ncbi:hypothetical protein LCGC14_2869490 [marine sediment metagenome]|uniref:Uncharacterized protein n=1 Tax=marine sediment metagenome TaxID=412755 RepID=A0A0F9ABM6_9ZZZZ
MGALGLCPADREAFHQAVVLYEPVRYQQILNRLYAIRQIALAPVGSAQTDRYRNLARELRRALYQQFIAGGAQPSALALGLYPSPARLVEKQIISGRRIWKLDRNHIVLWVLAAGHSVTLSYVILKPTLPVRSNRTPARKTHAGLISPMTANFSQKPAH